MVEYDEFEPIIVTSHDKGAKRGVAIYFSISDVDDLAENGIDLRTNRRFLCRITTDGKLVLIPFSKLNFLEKKEQKGWRKMDEKILEKMANLPTEEMDDLRDELIDVLIVNDVEMNPQEKAVMFQFVKGHSSKSIISEVVTLVNRVNPGVITQITERVKAMDLKPTALKPDVTTPKPTTKITPNNLGPPRKFHLDSAPKSLMDQVNKLSKVIKTELVDDLLSILSEDELEEFPLTTREKLDILQLTKGHSTPGALFNALQVALRLLEERKWSPAPAVARKVGKDLKFGVELVPAKGLDKLVLYGKKFEAGGIDNIWITDHYTNMDPYVTLTLMARATSVVDLGVGVTNPYVRHLAQTASAIASLDKISNNRMILGLGAGDKSTLAALNIDTKSALRTVLETVQAIRMLWDGGSVNFSGDIVKLQNARLNFKPDRSIPVYVGAQGPKMLTLAGEIGDGVLINGSHETDFKLAKERIIDGVNKAGKNINETDIVAYTCFSVGETKAAAKKATVPVVTFIAAATPPPVLERHDLNVEKAIKMKEALSQGDMSKAFSMVDDSYIEAFSISGTPQQCIDRIESLRKSGVTQFVFGSPLGPKKKAAVDLITNSILASYS